MVSFNKAISVLAAAFPGVLTFRHGETTKDKHVTLDVPESDDQNIFMGLANASQNNRAMRFIGTRRFNVVDEAATQVLVRESHPTPDPGPLVVKITKFEGKILHFVPVGTDVCCSLFLVGSSVAGTFADQIQRQSERVSQTGGGTPSYKRTNKSCLEDRFFLFPI